jgi:hypothetical protein
MRTPSLFLALAVACVAQDDASVVRFSNGDQLSGDLIALTDEKLSWKSQLLREPAEFDLKYVIDLSLPAGATPAERPVAAHEAILEMTNGDTIRGQLAGITDDLITLNTWYAGELPLRRVNVKSVKIASVADTYYRGPNSLDEWTLDDGGDTWRFRGGALHSESPAGIAREINFPDECVVSFEASWRGSFRPKIILFSNDITTSNPQAGYEMVFQGNSVHVKKAGSNNWLGHSTNAGVLRENEKARIEIKTSLKSGKIALYVDGAIIDIWQDDAVDKERLGKGFHIVSQDSSPLRVSNIEVTGWDGYLEDVPDRRLRFQGRFQGGFELEGGGFGGGESPEPAKEEIPEGRMMLRNGDTIEGEVLGIEGEEITLKTPFSEVKFPVSRLKNIALSSDGKETPKIYNGDVRATLADGSRIVFRLDGVEDHVLVGFSQNFGTARLKRDAFKRIEFNIYKDEMEASRHRGDW